MQLKSERGGRILLDSVGLLTMVLPYIADWNATHIYNPSWPPHAKFHNGQTMSLAVALGFSGALFALRKSGDVATNRLAGNIFCSSYWLTQISAYFFPGAAWTDPNLLKPGQSLGQFPPQGYALALIVLANVLTRGAINRDAVRCSA